jgi:hypothetical protein
MNGNVKGGLLASTNETIVLAQNTAFLAHPPKTMLCIFWDMKGVIYFELLTGKTTLNNDE